MGPWIRALSLVALLLQAQIGPGTGCECRDGRECGSPACPTCTATHGAHGHGDHACCQEHGDEPCDAPDDGPCDCDRCARARLVPFLGRGTAADASLARSDERLPALDRIAPAPVLIAVADRREICVVGYHGPPWCPSGASPDLLPVLRF